MVLTGRYPAPLRLNPRPRGVLAISFAPGEVWANCASESVQIRCSTILSRHSSSLGVVVAIRAIRVIDGIGKVQHEVPADNEELARAMCRFRCCCHQNSLYQLHTSRSHGYVSIISRFGGNTSMPALAMPVLCVAQFVAVLDATIVTTSLPAIRLALGFSDAGLQWVFTAYALVFGGLLIFGGRVADVAGRRRTFLIGPGLFTAASAGCALAWSPAALVAARVLQAAGAALLSPAALALLTTLSEPG